MFDKIPFQDISQRLTTASTGLLQGRENMEKTVRALLQGTFESMNLVSREEFEVQKAILAKTRERVEWLEARLAELEQPGLQPTETES